MNCMQSGMMNPGLQHFMQHEDVGELVSALMEI